jgi:hypothetical protein
VSFTFTKIGSSWHNVTLFILTPVKVSWYWIILKGISSKCRFWEDKREWWKGIKKIAGYDIWRNSGSLDAQNAANQTRTLLKAGELSCRSLERCDKEPTKVSNWGRVRCASAVPTASVLHYASYIRH